MKKSAMLTDLDAALLDVFSPLWEDVKEWQEEEGLNNAPPQWLQGPPGEGYLRDPAYGGGINGEFLCIPNLGGKVGSLAEMDPSGWKGWEPDRREKVHRDPPLAEACWEAHLNHLAYLAEREIPLFRGGEEVPPDVEPLDYKKEGFCEECLSPLEDGECWPCIHASNRM